MAANSLSSLSQFYIELVSDQHSSSPCGQQILLYIRNVWWLWESWHFLASLQEVVRVAIKRVGLAWGSSISCHLPVRFANRCSSFPVLLHPSIFSLNHWLPFSNMQMTSSLATPMGTPKAFPLLTMPSSTFQNGLGRTAWTSTPTNASNACFPSREMLLPTLRLLESQVEFCN